MDRLQAVWRRITEHRFFRVLDRAEAMWGMAERLPVLARILRWGLRGLGALIVGYLLQQAAVLLGWLGDNPGETVVFTLVLAMGAWLAFEAFRARRRIIHVPAPTPAVEPGTVRRDVTIGGVPATASAEAIPAEAPLVAESADLRITLVKEEWSNYQQEALIHELRLKIENLTAARQQISNLEFESEWLYASGRIEVSREVYKRQQAHPAVPSLIDPYDTMSGWIVTPFRRRVREGGTPGYTLTVKDAVGNEYRIDRPAQDRSQHQIEFSPPPTPDTSGGRQ